MPRTLDSVRHQRWTAPVAEGNAVHHHTVIRRLGAFGTDRLLEDTPGCHRQINRLGPEAAGIIQHKLHGPCNAQEFTHFRSGRCRVCSAG